MLQALIHLIYQLKKDFTTLKAKFGILDIGKLVNFPRGLSTKLDNLNVDKLKTVPIDLKKLSDVVRKKVVKKTKYSQLQKKYV